MPTTPNKGLEVQVTGSNSGTWGSVLNSNVFTILDNNLGGTVSKSLSNVNVTLSATESQSLILRLTGTLTGNVQVTTSCIGMTIVENLTSGAFSVSFTDGVGAVTLPQSARSVVITGAGAGARLAGDDFGSGTAMLFSQATAPLHWTKSVAPWNHALRLVGDGSGGLTGGAIPFTTAFASQTPSGTVGNTSLTEAQLATHAHFISNSDTIDSTPLTGTLYLARTKSSSSSSDYTLRGSATPASGGITSFSGSGQSHTHSFTGNAINFSVSYLNIILCTKD